MTRRAAAAALLLGAGLTVAMTTAALAHPLGNFSVNRYARIEVGPERTTLRYVLDLAEIPTLQELQAAGLGEDARDDEVERALLGTRSALIADRARLSIGGRLVAWEMRDASLALPEGQAGLRTMRIALTFVGAVSARASDALGFRDENEPGRSGWHEIVLRGVDGIELSESTAPASDTSDELRRYPADPLAAPPDASSVSALIRIGAEPGAIAEPRVANGTGRFGVDAIADRVTDLVRAASAGDLVATLLALAAAAGIGAAHAITPGHGKTVMAAYLVGTRGTARQAFALGGVVALSHTAGVLGLGAVILGASTAVAPERFYPYASALSALVVLGIGLRLVGGLVRPRTDAHAHHHGHDHPEGHAHDAVAMVGWRGLVALGASGGIVPSASALLLLLAAVSLRRPDLGVSLIVAFGIGMAAVLVAIGLTLVAAGRVASVRLRDVPFARRAGALLPAATAAIVLIVGAGLSLQAGQQLLFALP